MLKKITPSKALNKLKAFVLIVLFSSISNSMFATVYYSYSTGTSPSVLGNWWTATNGTGSHPANFTTAGDIFTIQSGYPMTTAATWTLTGSVVINDGGSLTLGAFATTISGTTTVGGGASGSLTISSNSGVKTFVGLVTINNGASFTSTTATTVTIVIFRGGITNNGTFSAGGASFNTNSQAITGTFSFINLTITAITLTPSADLTVTGTLTLSSSASSILNMGTSQLLSVSTYAINTSSTIQTACTANPPFPSPGATTISGEVEFTATAGGQFVPAGTYKVLTFDNTSGTNTALGNLVFSSSTFTTTAGGTLDMVTYTISGTITTVSHSGILKTQNTSAAPIITGKTWGGTVQYNALTGSQTIMAGTYATLILSNTSGTNTASGAIVTNTALTTTAGGTFDMSTFQLTGTITTLTHNGYLKTQNSSTPAIPASKTWGGTVEYYRAGSQSIAGGTYGHLIISGGSGTKTLQTDATVTGNFTVSPAGTIFADGGTIPGDHILTVNGNIIMNGTHTTQTTSNTGGSITISGGSATHDISGTGSFWNLIMNDVSYDATLSNSFTINGKLTLTSHNITLGAYDLTLSSPSGLSGGSSSSYLVTSGTGMLKRAIDVGQGTYSFPMGSATAYNPASIAWSSSPGVTRLDGKYTGTTVSAGSGLPFASSSCLTVSTLLDNGYWTFTEGVGTISTGFDMTLTRNGETNASTKLQDHAIVRRNSSASAWTDPGTWAVTTAAVTTATGQISPVTHTAITSVGEFAIAKGTHSAPVVAAIGGGVTVACLNTASGTAFTDATAGGVWSITSGTGSATIDASTGIITGTAQGTVTVNYTVTSGGDCSTTVTYTGTTVYDGGTITPTTTAICSGSTTTITVAGSVGTKQWQDNTNSAGWVNGTGTNPTSTTYTTPTLTYPNSYQFRMYTQGACPSINTITLTPLENGAAAPGVPTSYTFNYPKLTLAKYIGSCDDNYTFTQSLRNANANIAIGQTVTVTFMAGTDATTWTSGTFAGVAIDMTTVTKTATTITFITPVAVTFACPATNFTIVLNGITNPPYNSSGNATVSVANNATGVGGLDTGTYPYSTANHVGDFSDFDMTSTWDYTTQNSLGHCYTNLAAGTYCFEFTNPASGSVKIGTIVDAGTSGCGTSNAGWAYVSDVTSGSASGGSVSGQVLYENSCTSSASSVKAGTIVTPNVIYTTCFTIASGCDGENFCPLIDCSLGICGGGPLPIELLYFDAKLKNGAVELSWATATETNNDYFTIEKTIDGKVYFDFLKIKGAGNSTSVLQYAAVDDKPFEGVSYYRLQQTDYDGKFAYSRLAPVNMDPTANLGIQYVFGNVDKNTLQYQISNTNTKPISVQVLDILGNTILMDRIGFDPNGQTLYLNSSGLSRGVYLFRVSDSEHVVIKKFLY